MGCALDLNPADKLSRAAKQQQIFGAWGAVPAWGCEMITKVRRQEPGSLFAEEVMQDSSRVRCSANMAIRPDAPQLSSSTLSQILPQRLAYDRLNPQQIEAGSMRIVNNETLLQGRHRASLRRS